MHGHLNVNFFKQLFLCIAAPLVLLYTPSAKLRCPSQSSPLFSPIISFCFNSPGAYDKGCALQALFSPFASAFEQAFFTFFLSPIHLHILLLSCKLYILYTPQHYYMLIFLLHFYISDFYIWVHTPPNHNTGDIFRSQILPKSLLIPKTLFQARLFQFSFFPLQQLFLFNLFVFQFSRTPPPHKNILK